MLKDKQRATINKMGCADAASTAGRGDLDPRSLLAAAREAAHTCGGFLISAFEEPKSDYEEKSPGDLVSEVDRHSQRLAREVLMRHTPGAVFLAEEGAASGGSDTESGALT